MPAAQAKTPTHLSFFGCGADCPKIRLDTMTEEQLGTFCDLLGTFLVPSRFLCVTMSFESDGMLGEGTLDLVRADGIVLSWRYEEGRGKGELSTVVNSKDLETQLRELIQGLERVRETI